ncbi:hypothetical protein MJS38_04560, partial [Burkholderia gladioli]
MRRGEEERKGLRCRPGDLAIVTKCRVSERIGLIVRVVERCFEDGYDWVTDIQGPGTKGRDVHTGAICICSEMLARDESLTPIRGSGHPLEREAFAWGVTSLHSQESA